ncbi:hypothetical protein FZX09_09335 [Synechococcus sp. MU1643]|uniref:DUF7734 family protein n=1 Tax=Synechococcus sp. MU1643 TaxID=2508349 RepID=UPI001CF7F307|nr:hypothetical protein [Synechococcus sp. MU1643]MCB4428982.1 hypothetical protein [Synechococcus sp. MU1643]
MNDQAVVQALEERTRVQPQRVVRLRGQVGDVPFELLIFRGFSSSTTHPTAFDPDASVLPEGTTLYQAELLQGPLLPAQEVVLAGPMPPNDLLAQANW